ncbi:MAG: channel protein TolC [Pseudohongiella sp.]|nr:MAG: channel protein TolC [Pseudohongiella sp.]
MKWILYSLFLSAEALTLSTAFAADELPSFNSARADSSESAVGQTLEEFFTAALEYSPKIQIAEESMKIGTSRKQAANGRLLPQVRANASISDNRRTIVSNNQLQEFDGERYSIQLTQVLFNWQAYSARSAAYLVENQLETQYYGELSVLLTEVAEKYFDVLQASDALDSINAELDAVNTQLQQIESLYNRQLAQITDFYQAQASVAAVEAEQLTLQSDLALKQEALRSISGIGAGELFSLSESAIIPPLENSINYWVSQARENNHQIVAQEFAVQAAEKYVDESRGAYMPQVNFVIQRQDADVGFDNIAVPRTDNTYIGIDVSIPLYAGGSNRAAVREATSRRRIAESELRQIELEAGERVRSAYLQVQSAQTLIAAAQKLVESTTLTSTAMQRGFELGSVTSVDVLNALRDQFRAQRDLQKARYDHVKFLLMLKREAGILTAEDMLEVSSWLEPPSI